MKIKLVKEHQFSWRMENYMIAGLGLFLWILPGLLYIYFFNREIDRLRTERRHNELLAAVNKMAVSMKDTDSRMQD